jgi:serine/threonine protein kinase
MQKTAAPLIIADRFELTTEMREGGMAEVYKAFDAHADRAPCAIKRMKLQADEDAAKESFYREYRALEALEHRNIVRMLDYGLDDLRRPYIAMEWVERDLDSYIDQHAALGCDVTPVSHPAITRVLW